MIKELTIKADGVIYRIMIWTLNPLQFIWMRKIEQSGEDYTGFLLAEKLKMWMVFQSGSQ